MLPTITVDVGTTSVKLCLFDAEGGLVTSARHSTPTVKDGWGEIYDVEKLESIVGTFIRTLATGQRVAAQRIAITGVGESGGLVRADLSLASPMILWHDQRGAGYISSLSDAERALVYTVTGLPVNGNYGLSKIAWSVAHAKDAIGGAQWLNVSEYLAARMTGQRWSEYSLASRTMALDLVERTWSAEVSALVGLDVSVFPELRSASDGAAISAEYAHDAGLSREVSVHVVGHDHMVGAVGASLRPGELLNSTGTTEGLLFLRGAPSVDGHSARSKLANGIACNGDLFTLFASIPTGGSSFATLQSMLGLDAQQLTSCIDGVYERYMAGTIDLQSVPLVLPQFRGSPPPTKRASARGLIAGISDGTTTEDIVFGCFLGMTLQFRDVLELFPDEPGEIKVIGPASKNALWLQLKADLLGTPLSVSSFPEVVSRGAQALASRVSVGRESSDPVRIVVDEQRNAQLREWANDVRPQWTYLKDAPQ
jgi:sugar (pentulose or hexulose) kinase